MHSRIETMLLRINDGHHPRQAIADGTPVGLVLHELPLGRERCLVLDVASGLGWLFAGQAEPKELSADNALARLAMLDWCWPRMPVPTATALWQLESAELALASGEQVLRSAAAGMIRQSVAELRSVAPYLLPSLLGPDGRMAALSSRWDGVGGLRLPDPAMLTSAVSELRAALRARAASRAGPYAGALDPELPGCFEIEWDRVPPFCVDPRENALRVRVSARSWSVTIAAQRTARRNGDEADRFLWARLVDEATGAVAAEARLIGSERSYSVSAGLLDGPPARWRVDISTRPGDRARDPAARSGVLARQAVFRAQLFSRFATVSGGIVEWADLLHRRADRKLHQYRAARPGAPVLGYRTAPAGLRDSGPPFLAEELLDPTGISLFLSPHAGSRLPPP